MIVVQLAGSDFSIFQLRSLMRLLDLRNTLFVATSITASVRADASNSLSTVLKMYETGFPVTRDILFDFASFRIKWQDYVAAA